MKTTMKGLTRREQSWVLAALAIAGWKEVHVQSEFQALVTGAVMGSLMKAAEVGIMIDVEPVMDEGGNFTEKINVRGRETGEELLVVVMTEAKLPPPPLRSVE